MFRPVIEPYYFAPHIKRATQTLFCTWKEQCRLCSTHERSHSLKEEEKNKGTSNCHIFTWPIQSISRNAHGTMLYVLPLHAIFTKYYFRIYGKGYFRQFHLELWPQVGLTTLPFFGIWLKVPLIGYWHKFRKYNSRVNQALLYAPYRHPL